MYQQIYYRYVKQDAPTLNSSELKLLVSANVLKYEEQIADISNNKDICLFEYTVFPRIEAPGLY